MQLGTLKGSWIITVIYGGKYAKIYFEKLICKAEIAHKNNRITGTIIDIGGVGVSPDLAEMKGIYKNDELKFVKRYKTLHMINTDRTVTVDRTRRGKKIYYEAKYNPEREEFIGTWAYKQKILGLIPYGISYGGSWTMKRE